MTARPDPTPSTTTPSTPGPGATGYAGDLAPRAAWNLLATDPAAVLVDVRTEAEWRFVGVPAGLDRPAVFIEWTAYPSGAANPRFLDQLAAAGLAPGDGRPIVFLCRSGVRSVAAARTATQAGLGPAYNLLEGFEGPTDAAGHRGGAGWRAAGLPWSQP